MEKRVILLGIFSFFQIFYMVFLKIQVGGVGYVLDFLEIFEGYFCVVCFCFKSFGILSVCSFYYVVVVKFEWCFI